MVPFGHWQTELLQAPPLPQALLHAPQFAESLVVLVQRPLQEAKPVGQPRRQMPVVQLWPLGHTLPQAPQLLTSLDVGTHWPLHEV